MTDTAISWLLGGWAFGSRSVESGGRARHMERAPVSKLIRSPCHKTIDGIAVAELVQRLRVDDQDALATIYRALFPSLWRIALARVRSADIANDVVQNAFLGVWRRRKELLAETDVAVYLATAVRNHTRKIRMHDDVVSATEAAVRGGRLELSIAGVVTPRPDTAVEDAQFLQAYTHALAALNAREREAVLLRYDDGFSFEEIGLTLGVSKKGAHKIVGRALDKMRALLAAFDPAR
jgi:RNA polymerase sigma factor (sigma-70 family)